MAAIDCLQLRNTYKIQNKCNHPQKPTSVAIEGTQNGEIPEVAYE